MRAFRSMFLLWMLAMLAQMACAVGEVGGGDGPEPDCDDSYLETVEDDFHGTVDTSVPDAAPAFLFDAFIPGSTTRILQTFALAITFPPAFDFLGFDALGAGAQIGQLDFDFGSDHDFDEPPDYTIPQRAIDANTAYADSLKNGSYDAGTDAIATHSLGGGGSHVFTMMLPSGGTNFGGHCSYFDTNTRFRLPAGILQLPMIAGSYDVTVVATSVDPDTGDANDNAGAPPIVYQRTIPVEVPEPGASALGMVAIAVLSVRARRRTT